MKKLKTKKLLKYVLIDLIIGITVILFMVSYQKETTYVAIMDSIVVAGIIVISFGWFLYIYNIGIFDIVTYGVKQFGLALVKKRPKKSWEDYFYNKDKTPAAVHHALFIAGFTYILIGAILYLIYYSR